MNKMAGLFFACLMFSASVAFAFSQKTSGDVQTQRKIKLPYVIEEIDTSGNIVSTYSGVSDKADEFSVAKELGVAPYVEDHFLAFPKMEMKIGSKITLYRAPVFTLIDGKKKMTVRSWKKTVGELIAEQKLPEIGKDDQINFSLDTEIENGMTIKIIRVAITTIVKPEDIDYKVIKKDDKTLDEGKTRIEVKGEFGSRDLYYEVRREDGVEVSRRLIKTEITKEPVDQILIVGTKPVITVRCKYNETVLDAAIKNNVKPNDLCYRMMRESNGNPNSDGGQYKGLFQYDPGFWSSVSVKAGYSGASIWDAQAQIYTTAWAWAHGYRGRWPIP